MRFAREICLRHVKCLRTCVDLFHFTLQLQEQHFTISSMREIISHPAAAGYFTLQHLFRSTIQRSSYKIIMDCTLKHRKTPC